MRTNPKANEGEADFAIVDETTENYPMADCALADYTYI